MRPAQHYFPTLLPFQAAVLLAECQAEAAEWSESDQHQQERERLPANRKRRVRKQRRKQYLGKFPCSQCKRRIHVYGPQPDPVVCLRCKPSYLRNHNPTSPS